MACGHSNHQRPVRAVFASFICEGGPPTNGFGALHSCQCCRDLKPELESCQALLSVSMPVIRPECVAIDALATCRRGRAPLKMRVLVQIGIPRSETGGGGFEDKHARSRIFELNSLPPGL